MQKKKCKNCEYYVCGTGYDEESEQEIKVSACLLEYNAIDDENHVCEFYAVKVK